MRRTGRARSQVFPHGLLINTRQSVVYERNVAFSKGAAIHTERRGLGDVRYPRTLWRFRFRADRTQSGRPAASLPQS